MTATMVEAVLRGLALALVVGLGLSILRVRNVPARKVAWTLVLLALVAMPALMRWPTAAGVSGKYAWTLPAAWTRAALPQVAPEPAAIQGTELQGSVRSEAVTPENAAKSTVVIPALTDSDAPVVAAAKENARRAFHWPPVQRLVAWVYLSVAGALLLRLLIGLVWAMRIWTTAEPVSPLIAPEPHVRASQRIPSPVTIGSGIVLPADYREWDHQKLRMVLAHERSHVRQMDFYLQLLAGVYTAVFWFSPVGWWLRRALASLGEAIGDRAGMDAAASRSGYAQVVLEFAAVPRSSLPGVAMACSGNLSRRVESMLSENWFRKAFAEGRRRAIASLLLIPAAIFAVTALVRIPAAAAQTAPRAQQTAPAQAAATGQSNPPEDQVTTTAPADQQNPSAPAAPSTAPAAPAPGGVPADAPPAATAPAATDVAPAAPEQQAPPAPPAKNQTMAITGDGNGVTVTGPNGMVTADDDTVNGYGFRFSSDGDSYALVEGPGNKMSFSGDWNGDFGAEVDRARRIVNGPFLWFRHNGKSYIVTDPAIIAKMRSLYEPMKALGAQQRLLGQTQENLGKQEEALARAERDAAQVRMPDMSKEMADLNDALAKMRADQAHWDEQKLADIEAKMKADQNQMMSPERLADMQAKLAAVQAEWTPQRMAELEAKMGEMQAKLGQLEGEAGAKAGEFGSKMGQLGEEQGRLGAEQGRLGEQEGKIAQDANRQVQQIIQQSLGDGKARPVQ